MREIIESILKNYIVNDELRSIVKVFIMVGILSIAGKAISIFVKKVLFKELKKAVAKSPTKIDDFIFNKKFFSLLYHIVPLMILYLFSKEFSEYYFYIYKIIVVYAIWVIGLMINSFLLSFEEVYNEILSKRFKQAEKRSIRSHVQMLQIILIIICSIFIISALTDQSPWKLLSGIGAMTAIIILVFKDSILGFMAGLQLSAQNMVSLKDWISVPAYDADGKVVEINLTTIKIENWDKTISIVPIYELISSSFKNWTRMKQSGGRRIMRAIKIDVKTIKFCTQDMINKYKRIKYLSQNLEAKLAEIDQINKKHAYDMDITVNGKRLTNLSIFRYYLVNYLKYNEDINQDMTLMVRQLDPTGKGLPLEIYCFSNKVEWEEYEEVQCDIFDHIFSVIGEFELDVVQYVD